jgi:hypothetical protein
MTRSCLAMALLSKNTRVVDINAAATNASEVAVAACLIAVLHDTASERSAPLTIALYLRDVVAPAQSSNGAGKPHLWTHSRLRLPLSSEQIVVMGGDVLDTVKQILEGTALSWGAGDPSGPLASCFEALRGLDTTKRCYWRS